MKTPLFNWAVLSVGTVVGIAHIGILGHMMQLTDKYASRPQYPSINLPTGPYSSYNVEVDKEGYKLKYNANDPKTLTTTETLDLDRVHNDSGFFGNKSQGSEKRSTVSIREYTADGAMNTGMNNSSLGKSKGLSAGDIACIKSEGAGESTGGMVGASMTAGLAPTLTAIPYVGWLAAGWATLLGQKVGSSVGGEVAKTVNGC
jgi:hypothetical protein